MIELVEQDCLEHFIIVDCFKGAAFMLVPVRLLTAHQMADTQAVSVHAYAVTPVDLIIIFVAGVISQAILQYCCYLGLRSIIRKLFLSEQYVVIN